MSSPGRGGESPTKKSIGGIVDLEQEPAFMDLMSEAEAIKKDQAKIKDTTLVMSHKLLDMLDWKVNHLVDFKNFVKKVDTLYTHYEKTEKKFVDELVAFEPKITPRKVEEPPFPSLNKLTSDKNLMIKIDNELNRVLPEITRRLNRNGTLSVRAQNIPGFED